MVSAINDMDQARNQQAWKAFHFFYPSKHKKHQPQIHCNMITATMHRDLVVHCVDQATERGYLQLPKNGIFFSAKNQLYRAPKTGFRG